MAKRETELVSIRVPKGIPAEVRQLTGVPFSRVATTLVVAFLNNERKRQRELAAAEEADRQRSQS